MEEIFGKISKSLKILLPWLSVKFSFALHVFINCVSVSGQFVGLALKGLNNKS